MPIPLRTFGSTGRSVTRLGLGGEGILRTHGRDGEAAVVVARAVTEGISYFDSARAYAGSEAYYGAHWRVHPDDRARVFITSKSASYDAAGADRDLRATLANLAVDAIDLWQIHDVRTDSDLAEITRRGGSLEAFLRAREQGLVRHIGVTGHHDPAVLLRAVRELPIESVLLPVNVAEGALGGFITDVVPEAHRRGIAVVGMKVLGQGSLLGALEGLDDATLIRYALAQDVDVLIIGCSTPEEVSRNAAIASETTAMSPDEQRTLVARVRPHARSLAYYRRRS